LARLTRRKRQILEILGESNPSGFSLLNELRARCATLDKVGHVDTRRANHRRAFNRTVLSNFEQLRVLRLAWRYRGFDPRLTAGIFARWAVWELLDHGYLSSPPRSEELIITIGRDACSAFTNLKDGRFAIVGTAILHSDLIVVGTHEINENVLDDLCQTSWVIVSSSDGKLSRIQNEFPLVDLEVLPQGIIFENGQEVSTAKRKSMF